MKTIKRLYWTDFTNGKSRRAKCAIHDRPLFKITEKDGVRYRCTNPNCKDSNKFI